MHNCPINQLIQPSLLLLKCKINEDWPPGCADFSFIVQPLYIQL